MSTNQVYDEGREDAGNVAHDVDEGDALGADDGGQQLGGVLQADVVGDVDAEAAHDGEGGGRHAGRRRHGGQAEDAAHDHGAARQPAPPPPVQHRRQERVGGQLRGRRHRERHEHVQPQLAHVPHVPVEHQRDRHPGPQLQPLTTGAKLLLKIPTITSQYF